jgi:hypothetical protein
MSRTCSTYEGEEEYIQGFGGKARRKEITRKTRHKLEDNIKMDLREIGSVLWAGLIWLRIGTSGGLL